jgi:hypothetical protein
METLLKLEEIDKRRIQDIESRKKKGYTCYLTQLDVTTIDFDNLELSDIALRDDTAQKYSISQNSNKSGSDISPMDPTHFEQFSDISPDKSQWKKKPSYITPPQNTRQIDHKDPILGLERKYSTTEE